MDPSQTNPRRRRALTPALLALGLLALLLWLLRSSPDPADQLASPAPAEAVPDQPPAIESAAGRIVGSPPPVMPSDEVDPLDLGPTFPFRLDLQLVDDHGLPVPDALAFLAPSGCGFAMWPEPTDPRGRLSLRWPGRARGMSVTLALLAWGVVQPLRELELQADRPRTLAVVAFGRPRQPVTNSDREGLWAQFHLDRLRQALRRGDDQIRDRTGRMRRRDELDILCGREVVLFQTMDCGNCHQRSRIAGYAPLHRSVVLAAGLHPAAVFADHPVSDPTPAQLAERERLLRHSAVSDRETRRTPRSDPQADIAGHVLDADGQFAVGTPVACLGADGSLLARTATEGRGRFQLGVPPGNVELVAGGGDAGSQRTLVNAARGIVTEWDLRLERRAVVAGAAVDEAGLPLVGWRVEFEGEAMPWADLATTRADGCFLLSDLPGRGRLLLWSKEADLQLPVLAGPVALPDAEPVRLALAAAQPTRARLRLRPVLPGGQQRSQVEVRIFQLDTGRGTLVSGVGQDDDFGLEGLPAGWYRIDVGAPGLGWESRKVHVDGRGLWDAGAMALPRPGKVELRLADGQASPLSTSHGFYRRLPEADIRVEAGRDRDGAPTLAAGEHLLLWQEGPHLRAVAFRVKPGMTTAVHVPRRRP